jgi:hypothetical protein
VSVFRVPVRPGARATASFGISSFKKRLRDKSGLVRNHRINIHPRWGISPHLMICKTSSGEKHHLLKTMFTGIVEIVAGIFLVIHQSELSNIPQSSPSSIPKPKMAERT